MPAFNKETFESLYRSHIVELQDAESQMIEEMPRIIRAASSPELKTALELHLTETKEQAARLKAIVETMEGPLPHAFSSPMRALLANSRLLIAWHEPSVVLDTALIAAARQVEYYEMASYSVTAQLAGMLHHARAAALLKRTFKEEQETALDLGQIAESLIMGEELDEEVREAEEEEEPIAA